jgi:hypothetical protein
MMRHWLPTKWKQLVVVALLASATTLILFNRQLDRPFWVLTSGRVCAPAHEALRELQSVLQFENRCLFNILSGNYFVDAYMRMSAEKLPITIRLRPNGRPVRKVVLHILGGPGGGSAVPKSWSWANGFAINPTSTYVENCNAALLMPAYMGTFERSNYPGSSHEMAEAEVGALIKRLTDGTSIKTHILADSLGGNIISAPSIPIPAGQHLLLLPLLKSPNQTSQYWMERKDFEQQKYYYSKRYIKGSKGYVLKSVPIWDYFQSYFGSDPIYLRSTFVDRWQRKTDVAPGTRVHVVIARNDGRAGGASYAPKLRKLGFTTEIIEGDHEKSDGEDDRVDNAMAWFEKQVCAE